jgi:sulfide:quinone oxidoreductase
MTHTVIIGGGAAGWLAAQELAEAARDEERITLVATSSDFRSAPGLPGSPASSSPSFDLAQNLGRKGIEFSSAGARRLHPERRQLELGDGSVLEYDILLIAAGPRPAFDEVEGLGPEGYTQSLCETQHLAGCAQAWNRLVSDPGPVIVGAVQGASCFGPAYETAIRMDIELRRKRLRERIPITFVTAEPFIGELGVGGIEDSRDRLERELRDRDIAWITRARVDRVDRGTMHVTRLGRNGAPPKQYALAFRYALMMPPFRSIAAVDGIEGLVNERGFIIVDEFLRNPRYRNIYAAGATIASAASAQGQRHKTAYVIDGMVNAAVRNIRDTIDGRAPSACPVWSEAHLVDYGAGGLSFAPDSNAAFAPEGGIASAEWVHLSRCAICDVGEAAKPVALR